MKEPKGLGSVDVPTNLDTNLLLEGVRVDVGRGSLGGLEDFHIFHRALLPTEVHAHTPHHLHK